MESRKEKVLPIKCATVREILALASTELSRIFEKANSERIAKEPVFSVEQGSLVLHYTEASNVAPQTEELLELIEILQATPRAELRKTIGEILKEQLLSKGSNESLTKGLVRDSLQKLLEVAKHFTAKKDVPNIICAMQVYLLQKRFGFI